MRPDKLHHALAKHAPIDGVSIGDENDKTTWRIDFKPSATEEQKAAARAALMSYEEKPEAPPVTANDVLDILVQEGVIQKAKADAVRAKGRG